MADLTGTATLRLVNEAQASTSHLASSSHVLASGTIGADLTAQESPAAFVGVATLAVTTTSSLSTQIRVAGTATVRLSAAGTLAGETTLAGIAGLTVTTTSALTTAIRVSGTATVRLSAVGTLGLGPAVYTLVIAGMPIAIQPHWTITAPANGIGTMRFDVISLDGSYVPGRGAEVVFYEDSVRIFAGNVYSVRERGLANEPVTRLVSEVAAQDFNAIPSRFYYGTTIPAGTLKAALIEVLPNVSAEAVTLDPAQVDGPALPALDFSDAWLVSAIFDHLAQLTGYVWEIDYHKVLRMYQPGSLTAPFNITAGDGSIVGDVTSEPSVAKYANQIIVQGTGVSALASDTPEILAHGQWQLLVKSPDTTTQAAADALAFAVLAASLPFAKKITYETYERGLVPGQTQTINIPQRHLNNTFLVTDVESRGMEARDITKLVRRRVSAIEGLVYQTGWREAVKAWGGSGGGLTMPSISGGGGASAFTRFAYYLGGSGLDFVQSPTPTWIAANPLQVQINTVPRGSTLASITVRLRALEIGVSVQARLFDYTTSTPCPGTSAVVTSTTWTTAVFTVTLTAGSDYYGLQLLSNTAGGEVAAMGYLE